MTVGKGDRLQRIVEQLIDGTDGSLTSCVVTNERGLVVAGLAIDGSSNQHLAAMISLLSDTAYRVNTNLGFGNPRNASVEGFGVSVSMHEFLVDNKRFRIGAILNGDGKRKRFFRRKMTRERIERSLLTAAIRVRRVLES